MCGIVGIFGDRNSAIINVIHALHALQHRGQESAGAAVSDGITIRSHKGMGRVGEVLNTDNTMHLAGSIAIGHTRYSTTGNSVISNAQPFVYQDSQYGPIAIVHNGNLVKHTSVRQKLLESGASFSSSSDTETALALIASSNAHTLQEAIMQSMSLIEGGFAFLILSPTKLYAIRDPHGLRPLVLGKITRHNEPVEHIVASETCVFDMLGAQFVRDIRPGEMVVVDHKGVHSHQAITPAFPPAPCVFGTIYFQRPDSRIDGESLAKKRIALGRALAKEHPVSADYVVGVPASAIHAAEGFAEELGLRRVEAIIRNINTPGGTNRSFIAPDQVGQEAVVDAKLIYIADLIKGKKIALIDDSIVRGTVTKRVISKLIELGALEVHLRITAPPYVHPCHYGIDTADQSRLAATGRTIDEIRRYVGATSLGFLSLQSLLATAATPNNAHFCHACFSGKYPVAISHPDATHHDEAQPVLTHS